MNVIRIAVCVILAFGLMACDSGDDSGGGGSGNQINAQNVERVAANALILGRLVDEGIKNGVTTDHTIASGCSSGIEDRTDNKPEPGIMEVFYDVCDAGDLIWDGVIWQPTNQLADPYRVTFLELQMIKEGNTLLHPYLNIGESILLWGDMKVKGQPDDRQYTGSRLDVGFVRQTGSLSVSIENYKLEIARSSGTMTEYVLDGSVNCDILPFVIYETRSKVKREDDHYPHAGVILIVANDGSGVLIDIQSDVFVTLDCFDIFGLTVEIIDTTWQELASQEDVALLGLFSHYWLRFN